VQYTTLGRTGVTGQPACLGAMMFGQDGNPDHDDCVRVMHRAFEPVSTSSTRPTSTPTASPKEIVGAGIRDRRDEIIVATKLHHPDERRRPQPPGLDPVVDHRACEDSLRRLGTDYIDLYQVHRVDPLTDIDETLGALSDLVRQGKVRMIGCCTFPPSEIVESHWVAEQRGHVRFRCNQPPYSIFARESNERCWASAPDTAWGSSRGRRSTRVG
jgi:aryl-alcohol dehydrogenase (NADP+)